LTSAHPLASRVTAQTTQLAAQLPGTLPDKPATEPSILVLTTLPQQAQAEALARELLTTRLAACIQIGATMQSLYHWRGQIETAREVPLSIKTRATLYSRVEETIRRRHPYELPEIVAVPISCGLPAYLEWIAAETAHEGG
jgi:periplasmic divalent cation tolerance protein